MPVGRARHVAGGYLSGELPYLDRPETLEDALEKWTTFRDRLLHQMTTLGRDFPDLGRGQLGVADGISAPFGAR